MKKLLLFFVLSFFYLNHTSTTMEMKNYTPIHNEVMTFCKEKQFNQNFYFK
ncbi:hypothetical protein [Flavobacterium sp.]|uniref:hypothetical protein n=1 Tax=Flavobacterium sp. TaxID=239 RepID=UPI003528B87F